MSLLRWRLVYGAEGHAEHISSVVMTEDEALESLGIEEEMHRNTGWRVSRVGRILIAERPHGKRRTISIRAFDPMEDVSS